VEVIRANLTDAKYTLAVPSYTYKAACGTSRTSNASRRSSKTPSTGSNPAMTATGSFSA